MDGADALQQRGVRHRSCLEFLHRLSIIACLRHAEQGSHRGKARWDPAAGHGGDREVGLVRAH